MILRAIAVWWVLLLAAVANGGARDAARIRGLPKPGG
jgi:hypothetical protein